MKHICPCWHCQNPIRFSEERAGENVNCPHCGQETQLFVPGVVKKQSREWLWLIIGGGLAVVFLGLWLSGNDQAAGAVMALMLTGTALVIYFLPSIIAAKRGHRNGTAIAIVNLFLGWTLVGWVVALAWAVYEEKPTAKIQ